MGDEVDLFFWDVEHFLQKSRGVLAHHNQAVRERGDFVHDKSLIGIWLAENRMQCRHHRHLEALEESYDVAAGWAAENAVLMLKRDQINIAEIKKVGSIFIG